MDDIKIQKTVTSTTMPDEAIVVSNTTQRTFVTTNVGRDDRTKVTHTSKLKKNKIPALSVDIFSLEGEEYRSVGVLSNNSGEAQVYLVEKEEKKYVLKLYYPNFKPKENLLRVLWNMQFEFIVRLYAYGKMFINGTHRSYELMEYLEGGTLNEYVLNKNEKQFKKIALIAAAALAFCHNNNIIHKDIKPGNFFFRDKEQTQLVLGDFGISSFCDDEEILHKTTQARTPLYAAPEMYEDVLDGEVEITPQIDFYSLGVTLLFVWLGNNPFPKDERIIMRMKNEGKLPMVDNLPDFANKLVRGLTIVNPLKRWGYDEVERWYKGEDVEIDESSVYLRYKSFIVDPDKNVIAQDAKELVPLLYDRKALGIKYLYSGRISKWLEECGNSRLSLEIEDIVEKLYPLDQNTGFLAALYVLDSNFPYYDLKGKTCYSIHEITLAIMSNMEEYELLLKNPNNELFIYLQSVTELDIDRLRSYFKTDPSNIALWKLLYEMDNDVPFLGNKPSTNINFIVNSFATKKCSEDEWRSLVDGRLLSWMFGKCEKALCEEIRLITEKKTYNKTLAYNVLYHLNRNCGYDLKDADTSEKIAILLSKDLQKLQDKSDVDFTKMMADYIESDGKLFLYAKLHGWNDFLHDHLSCFDLNPKGNNKELYSAYDLRTAAYKFCAMIGKIPGYIINDKIIHCIEDLDLLEPRIIRNELKNGSLKQWISIFFHENPYTDFSKQYSYEHALEDYLMKIGQYDPSDNYYRRFLLAKEQSTKKMEETKDYFREAHEKEIFWKKMLILLTGVLIVLLLLFRFSNSTLLLENITYAVGVPVGIGTMVLCGVWAYFAGFGTSIICLAGLVGILSSLVPIWLMKWAGESSSWLMMPMAVLIIIGYFTFAYWECHKKSLSNLNELNNVFKEDISTSLLEPLYYTFKTKSFKYKGSNFGLLDDVVNVVKASSGELIIHYMMWCLFMGLLILEFICYHKYLLNLPVPDIDQWIVNIRAVIHKWNDVK